MTAAKRAKQLGAKSLKQIAEAWGVTPQAMEYQFKTNPSKFDIIVRGAVKERNDEIT